MITVQLRRAEALSAGFEALADRLPSWYTFPEFCAALSAWTVKAFCAGDRVIGMLMLKNAELHVAIIEPYRGKWLSRRLIREVLAPLVKRYGAATTNVLPGNRVGQDFITRIGFARTEQDSFHLLREGFAEKHFDPVSALVSAGASIIGGAISSDAQSSAANNAAQIQGDASAAGIAETRRQFDAVRELLKPYVDVGNESLTAQKGLLGLNGPQAQQDAYAGVQGSPAFDAISKVGENAILQNASAIGGLRGGNVQAVLAQFRPQLLAQLIESQYGKLGGLTSVGQNAAAGVGNAGMSTGNNIAQLLAQQGAAGAGGALAAGRATAAQWGNIAGSVGQFAGMGGFKGLGDVFSGGGGGGSIFDGFGGLEGF